MRLWSLHPKYLDRQGLVALWREALLAQAVLRGLTTGYRAHPQLERFREARDPVAAIGAYLRAVHDEATSRGYRFARSKIFKPGDRITIRTTRGQVEYEFRHLLNKLKQRDPTRYHELIMVKRVTPNPMTKIVPGRIEPWERVR
jgi:hypothetical protein